MKKHKEELAMSCMKMIAILVLIVLVTAIIGFSYCVSNPIRLH